VGRKYGGRDVLLEKIKKDLGAHGVDTTTPSSTARPAGPRKNVTKAEVSTFHAGSKPSSYSLETKKKDKKKLYRTTAHHRNSGYSSGWHSSEKGSRDSARRAFSKAKAKQV
tara:strand:+ start:300 stop:632 length:333 start_codon:yes stop_codon:yes gene_type:complete